MKNLRVQIARNLQATGYVCSHLDYCQIADAIRRGRNREDILSMTELERWPLAFDWLKETI
jgi:hypothetical protein